MNCPVCKRSLAPTLSICPACGAMMNDTVREELQSKITARPSVLTAPRTASPQPQVPRQIVITQPPVTQKRINTTGLAAPKTSPTLIEFQHKNIKVPEWRIQLQNAVQQRKGGQAGHGERAPLAATVTRNEVSQPAAAEVECAENIGDPRVANALKRIAESRKTYLGSEAPPKRPASRPAQPRPFGVVKPTLPTAPAVSSAPVSAVPKPQLANVAVPPVLKRDTNKLPRIEIAAPRAEEPETISAPAAVIAEPEREVPEIKRIQITVEKNENDEPEWPVEEVEDIEDLAPFSMRFGAGLFDIMIGVFASMLLLSPLVFAGVEWMTWAGLVTLAGTSAVTLFLYLTASLGFFGKTVGMKLFSLELVDAVENEYPTIRQSAVNSSLFLLSLIFAGAGFVTMLFNEEKRALHDLVSGTILVREF